MLQSRYLSFFLSFNFFLLLMFYAPFSYSHGLIFICLGVSVCCYCYVAPKKTRFGLSCCWDYVYVLPLLLLLAWPFLVMVSNHLYLTKIFFIDHAKHNAMTGALLEPGFPHANPYVGGSYLWYYWISYIPGAVLAKLFNLPIYQVNRLMPVVYAGFFLKTIHVYFSDYLNVKQTRYAVYALIFLGGWDWLYFYVQAEPFNVFVNYQPDLIWEWSGNDFRLMVAYNIERSMLYLWPHVFSLSNLIMSVYVLQKQYKYWPMVSAVFLATSLLASSLLAPVGLSIFMCTALLIGMKDELDRKRFIFKLFMSLSVVFLCVIPYFASLYIQKHKSLVSMEISMNPLFSHYQRGSNVIEGLKPFVILKYIFLEFGGSVFALGLLLRKKYWIKTPFLCSIIALSTLSFLCFRIFGRTDWSAKHSILMQYSLSALWIIYCFKHQKNWPRYVLGFCVLMSLPSTMMNVWVYSNHKRYSAVYSESHLQAEQWIRQHIDRGNIFLAPPGNTFVSAVLSRPLRIADGHHSGLFFANRYKVRHLLTWLDIKSEANVLQFICEGRGVDYFWFEPHDKKYLFLKDHFETVYANEAGTLLKIDCVY